MRVAVELVHMALGLAAALAIGSVCAWAYPLARGDIWLVMWVAVAGILLLGIRPVREAWNEDRLARTGSNEADTDA